MPPVRRIACLLALLLPCGGPPAPAEAANFFEELFGFARTHEAPAAQRPHFAARKSKAREARRHEGSLRRRALEEERLAVRRQASAAQTLALAKAKHPLPCCMSANQTIDLMINDDTLRPGDAYATADGLRVFVGSSKTEHTEADFVPLAQARNISAATRARLAAASPQDARRAARAPRTAVALATPTLVVHSSGSRGPERSVTDAQGKSIRFVGGAVPQP